MNALDLVTGNGKSVLDIGIQPILDHNIELTVVDVGARGGMHELPESYAKHAHWIGFEPNADEHKKIITHTTDAESAGYIPPKWKRETIQDVALWNEVGTRKLHVTNAVSSSSMMGEVIPEIADRIFIDYGGAYGVGVAPISAGAYKTVSVEDVNCEKLDNIIDTNNVVDYLKVDVEGAESIVFEGAESLLSSGKVLFIRTEFFCVPFYESHKLFGHQHAFLHNHGYRLLNIDLGGSRYTRCKSRIPKMVDKGLPFVGDALYTLDPDRNEISAIDLQRIGLVSLTFGLRSYGLSVFRDAKLLSENQLDDIESALSRVPFRRWLRRHWENFPAMVAVFLYTGRWSNRAHQWRYDG